MGKAIYSFGEESPMKFEISDRLANLYNEALNEFFKAQQRFNQKHGRKWDPVKDPIKLKWSRSQRQAWNDFSHVFDAVIKKDGPFHINDIMEDFLVKNPSVTVSAAFNRWGMIITLSVFGGTLYGLFRGR